MFRPADKLEVFVGSAGQDTDKDEAVGSDLDDFSGRRIGFLVANDDVLVQDELGAGSRVS
jgi:hypothetical protein